MRVFAGVMGALLLAIPPPGFAQNQGAGTIEEAVVTAQRVEQNVQQVPIAVTVLSSAVLEDNRVINPSDLQLNTPSASAQELFQESYRSMSRSEQLEPYSNPIVLRNRQAMIDTSSLFRPASNNPDITLNLFPDVELRAQIENTRSLPSGASFMYGSLEDGGHIALFYQHGGIVRGEVHSPGGVYTIQSSRDINDRNDNGGTITTIRQMDTSKLPAIDDCAIHAEHDSHSMTLLSEDVYSDQASSFLRREGSSETPDEPVDMLVVYTSDAESSEGGVNEIRATIEAEVEKTNQAFINSGLSHRQIRLVAMEKVEYTQSTEHIGDDLYYLYPIVAR